MKAWNLDLLSNLKSEFHTDLDAFLIDRQARGFSRKTVEFYRFELGGLMRFLHEHGIDSVQAPTADLLRRYLLSLGDHRNPGGVSCAYRAMKTFYNWCESENLPDSWRNPIEKVKSPKVGKQLAVHEAEEGAQRAHLNRTKN